MEVMAFFSLMCNEVRVLCMEKLWEWRDLVLVCYYNELDFVDTQEVMMEPLKCVCV
jgi:hypothetical protein